MENEGIDDDYIPPTSKKGLDAIMRAVRSNYQDNKLCNKQWFDKFKKMIKVDV